MLSKICRFIPIELITIFNFFERWKMTSGEGNLNLRRLFITITIITTLIGVVLADFVCAHLTLEK